MDCKTALLTILDQVDYTAGNCRATEMVGAVLPKEVIKLAREAIASQPAHHINSAVKHIGDMPPMVDFLMHPDEHNG